MHVPEFVMRERAGFVTQGRYELLTVEGVPLGTVEKVSGAAGWFFGSAVKASYRLVDAAGQPLATIVRPGTWGKMRFQVVGADGGEVGTLEQENSFGAPRLVLHTADGWAARLTGGGFGSGGVRTLSRGQDGPAIGQVSKQRSIGGFLAGTDTYLVRLSDQLTGGPRLLAVVAVACIDMILDEKKSRATTSGTTAPGSF